MKDRSKLVAHLRGELVGPAVGLREPRLGMFVGAKLEEPEQSYRGPIVWQPSPEAEPQEVLHFERESPHRKYGVGLLYPDGHARRSLEPDTAALVATDTVGADVVTDEAEADGPSAEPAASGGNEANGPDEFDVNGADIWNPSALGISVCAQLEPHGAILVRLPQSRRFQWQAPDTGAFQLNGRYEAAKRSAEFAVGGETPVWRRVPAVGPDTTVRIDAVELEAESVVRKMVPTSEGSPLRLRVEVFGRHAVGLGDAWLLTVVLRNVSDDGSASSLHEKVLYQTFFEVSVAGGRLERYPENQRPFAHLDAEEQSLRLLYRSAATWGIGHGCAAGWDCDAGAAPETVYADVMPAVELPSMTPEISFEGKQLDFSMSELATLSDDGSGAGWAALTGLVEGYHNWIRQRQTDVSALPADLQPVAKRHLEACVVCLDRIRGGIGLLRSDVDTRRAFRLANRAMYLQQLATKDLSPRPLQWQPLERSLAPAGQYCSPWERATCESPSKNLGRWRAFQVAFFLMSLQGTQGPGGSDSADREIVDLIWFPTGGGKTEAYLAVSAFYLLRVRLAMSRGATGLPQDGTNVLMRYTLRMLTTQQFQRASSLICALEFLRRHPELHGEGTLPGRRFSLGLWIGGDGSPNKIANAREELARFRNGDEAGNPLVLTECPWCRAEIGRFSGTQPKGVGSGEWKRLRVRGVADHATEGPMLHCPDPRCEFGQEDPEHWLPVEVIDERIYKNPPSLVIGTADKLAIMAYRPESGAIFGRRIDGATVAQVALPPGLIIQDELHLISGPLGTMYALYEGIIERLCSWNAGSVTVRPKIIASTATIRGAAEQVAALYDRPQTQLFPSPGLDMGDSFFGTYARESDGRLASGRLYLGVHAVGYGSILTTQVRTFATALLLPSLLEPERRDPWWTLLAFYNSIRELAGAKTLFDSDIRSRLKFLFNREGYEKEGRRHIRVVEELTSRLSQAEIVDMMGRLSRQHRGDAESKSGPPDACLASNIIEVGVDIDRLSLMGVTGQPKTTATYIQVTGRVGRRWWERPGLIVTMYSPARSRDRSHYEQFHSYHRRLYERVEPATATPFAVSAIQRGLAGALLLWARQQSAAPVSGLDTYSAALEDALSALIARCGRVAHAIDRNRSVMELHRCAKELKDKWQLNPQEWERFPQAVEGEYLMLWPGEFATATQRRRGVTVPSSLRQVDGNAELTITEAYTGAGSH